MAAFPYVDEPGECNLTVYQGSSFSKSFIWKRDGVALPLTGCHARAQVRPYKESSKVILSLGTDLATPFGLSIVDDAGRINLFLSSTVTATLQPDQYVWDLEVVDPNESPEFVSRLLEGTFTVDGEVTR